MYKLTLGSLTISDAKHVDIVKAAAAGGFVGCGMRVTGRKIDEDTVSIVGNPGLVRDIRAALDDTGITLTSIAAYHFTPEIKVSDFDPVIDAAGILGVKTFGVACQDADESRFVDKLGAFSVALERVGGRVSIEVMPYSQARTLEQTSRLIERTGRPNVGFNLDSLHVIRSGAQPSDIRDIDPKRIFLVQICDAPAKLQEGMALATESRTSRLYPGNGALPLYEFLDAIPRDRDVLECEAPCAADRHLPASERAKRAGDAMRRYLERYLASRGRAA